MKEITLPELCGVDDSGQVFGLAEFLAEALFTRADLLDDVDFCETVRDLMPVFRALKGPSQVGQKVRIADRHHKRLLACSWTHPRVAGMNPERALMLAQFRLAVARAEEAKEEQPQANGAPKEASPS